MRGSTLTIFSLSTQSGDRRERRRRRSEPAVSDAAQPAASLALPSSSISCSRTPHTLSPSNIFLEGLLEAASALPLPLLLAAAAAGAAGSSAAAAAAFAPLAPSSLDMAEWVAICICSADVCWFGCSAVDLGE